MDNNSISQIIKNLYNTNFLKISLFVTLMKYCLLIVENPIIQNIEYRGIKANKIVEDLKSNSIIKRSSYNEILLKQEKSKLLNILRERLY